MREVREIREPVTPTDVKQYIFCPLIPYYQRVLGLKPVLDFQQSESKEMHEELRRKVGRREYPIRDRRLVNAEVLDVGLLYSERLNALGRPDMVLKIGDGELTPVDFKLMKSNKGRAWDDHVAQLGLYALLVEESLDTTVYRGFIYYVPEERAVEVRITPQLRKWVEDIVRRIREIDETQNPPETWRDPEKCSGGCGYRYICIGMR